MGYNTYFKGSINFSRELTVPELRTIQEILDTDEIFDLANKYGYAFRANEKYNDYISVVINDDYTGLCWNGAEKTRNMVGALNVIMYAIRSKIPDLNFCGEMLASGEEAFDVWGIRIVDEFAERFEVFGEQKVECPHCKRHFMVNGVKK